MSDKLRLGMIGFGGRGIGMLKFALLPLSEDEVDLVQLLCNVRDEVEAALEHLDIAVHDMTTPDH